MGRSSRRGAGSAGGAGAKRRKTARPRASAGGRSSRAGQTEARQPRESLYAEVTARIVAELEAGRFPWVQPWDCAKAGIGLPANAASGRRYSGVNILILWSALIEHGHALQRWLTFRQALEAGGNVRKGERGTTVVYADRFTPEAEKERAEREGGEPGSIPFLKRFTLFNVAQCEGLPEALTAPDAPPPPRETVPAAEALIAATRADFRIGGGTAFYSPAADFVAVPPQQAFTRQIDYYRTALHELGHWTGHPTRLGRDQSGGFGSPSYAREELVAELCAAFTCASLGITPTVRHADYLGSWLDVLRSDSRAIFKAAGLASKASDFLLAFCGQAAALEAAA